MRTINTILVKAFTLDKNQGNPAGVTLDADGLTDEQMRRIAQKVGASESVFVQESKKADFKLRFFSSVVEINLCGHAALAAAHCLKQNSATEKESIRFETKAGIVEVTYQDELMLMRMPTPTSMPCKVEKPEIASLLNINYSEILDFPFEIISTGTPKMMIGIKSLKSLFAITPDFEAIKTLCLKTGARGLYAFTSETIDPSSDFHARQFNPLAGINEDPVTGVAAAALGAYATKHNLLNKKSFVVEQGHIMDRFGKIFVNLENGIQIGGFAVVYREMEFDVSQF